MRRLSGIALFLLPFFAATAFAQPAACPDADPLPPALAGWTARPAMLAADAPLMPGTPARAGLQPMSAGDFPLPPERAPGAQSFGAILAFAVPKAGTWRVALSAAAWIDVVTDGERVTSTTHGHGPACSGIRKMVDFPLGAGRYTLQISNADADSIDVMIARVP